MGSFLGRVHDSYSTLEAPTVGAVHLRLNYGAVENLLELANFHRRVTGDAQCIRIITGKLARLSTLNPAVLDLAESIPQQVVHGDFYLCNIVFARSGAPRLIDFDQTCRFFRCYEVIRGIMTAILYADERTRIECLRAYVSAYREIVDLTDRETEAMLPLFYSVLLGDPSGLEPSDCPARDYTALRDFALYRWQLLKWIEGRFAVIQETISRGGMNRRDGL
jgi:Ser/Thr protein kinase RdoA (MazF antagonist)